VLFVPDLSVSDICFMHKDLSLQSVKINIKSKLALFTFFFIPGLIGMIPAYVIQIKML